MLNKCSEQDRRYFSKYPAILARLFCSCRRARALRRKMLAPVRGDIGACAEPDVVETAHVFEEPDQALAAAGAADQAVVQADGKEFRRTAFALAIEHVEGIAHVGEEVVAGGKAAVLVEAIVVGFVGVGDDEMRPAGNLQP